MHTSFAILPHRRWWFAFMLVASALLHAAPSGWNSVVQCRRDEGNIEFTAPWGEAGAASILVVQKSTERAIRLDLRANGWKATEQLPGGYERPLTALRYFPTATPDPERADTPITIKFRENEWSFYVDGILRGIMAAPFALPGEVCWPQRPLFSLSEPMRFRPVPRAAYTTDFMIEEGAPNELYPWNIQLGAWGIHTALQAAVERPETDQKRTKEAPLVPDKSPNFYSLKGGGQSQDAIITTGYDYFDNYHLTGALQLENGEAGIVFYHRDETPPTPADPDAELPAPDPAKADFYAFTIRMNAPAPGQNELRLWKQYRGQRTVLARAYTPLYANQWYQPGIKAHGNEIICFLDGFEVFRVTEQLPVGGKIGLFANTPESLRFDDIALSPYTAFHLHDAADLRYNTLHAEGALVKALEQAEAKAAGDGLTLFAGAGRDDASLILGRTHNRNMLLEDEVTAHGTAWAVGLIAGWQSPQKPHFRFQIERLDNQTICSRLLRVSPKGDLELLEETALPSRTEISNEPFTLMVDATGAGFLRCRLNGVLIHLWQLEGDLEGAAGLWQRADTYAVHRQINLSDTRQVYRDLEQKNPIFQADSFMRHWASPEGQWISGGANLLWHKGDFFGDFAIRLPVVNNSELHLAVADGDKTGPVVITVADGKITLATAFPEQSPTTVTADLPIVDGAPAPYVIHHEGTILWIEANQKIILRQRIDAILKKFGTRILAKNFTLTDMSKSKVTRDNIIDEFFNESPYMWLANGGDWQIINRFQCTPSWSHMIGEAPTGLGAFWRKQIFAGDLTLEFYAGSRQGYYDDAGNLNCTIMADRTSPSRGYTVACTEWDQNLSQNWTTMYKNGESIAATNAYLVPRRRKGMYRRILNPLVSEGRPIHGAWYYIKLRKIGDKLEYSFDDEVIFTETDPEAIQEGLIGIWTFVHSMTLAQIKITFENVRPRSFPVKRLPLETATPAAVTTEAATEAKPAAEAPHPWTATVNSFPLDPLAPARWTCTDPVGQSIITPFSLNASALLLRNQLGSGAMRLDAALPATPLAETAGWQVRIKRTEGARFNFFYSIGAQDGNGSYRPLKKLYHHITGADFTDAPTWIRAGATTLPAAPHDIGPDRHDWTTVTIWIPSSVRTPEDATQKRMVRPDGFGIERRDAIANGIQGNGPGEAYAISQFVPIFYNRPKIEAESEDTCYVRASLDAPKPPADATLDEQWAELPSQHGLNHAWITLRRQNQSLVQQVAWVEPHPELPFTLAWDNEIGDAVRLTHDADYVDPRLAEITLYCLGKPLTMERFDDQEVIRAVLPKTDDVQKAIADAGAIAFQVKIGAADAQEITLSATAPERRNTPPALMAVEGFSPIVMTFENGAPESLQFSNQRMAIRQSDDRQGAFLQVRNTAYEQALETPFSMNFSMANYPLVQFRYRAWDMAQVSLSFRNSHYVRLAPDDSSKALAVRHAHDLVFDETWRTWLGIAADAFVNQPFSVARFTPSSFKIASIGSPDQTGRYSRYHLDDLVFGPAVKTAEQLSCTPRFYDADGVTDVFSAILPGATPATDVEEQKLAALTWTRHDPGSAITPSLKDIPDGICHLLLKAKDARGLESHITDLPFLLDTKPMTAKTAIVASNHPHHNGTMLTVTFDNSGAAPWSIEKAKFFVVGKEIPMPQWTNVYAHSKTSDQLQLNHPFLFRNHLNQGKDGDVFEFAIDNIIDGAGNQTERVTVPVKIDYASDKTGPSWYSLTFGASVNWFINWDGCRSSSAQLTPGRYNSLDVINNTGRTPFLSHGTYHSRGDLSQAVAWQPTQHPCLSFRLANNNPRSDTTFRIVLTTTADRAYTISLTKPGTAATELNRSKTFTWIEGQWQRVSFNVLEALQKIGVAEDAIKNLTFKSIEFQRRGAKHRDTIYLDDMFIHGPAEADKPDLLKWTAFDASGVASLEATAVDDLNKDLWTHSFTDLANTDLNALRAKFKGQQWFRCQAKDKAGNLSVAFWLPLFAE
jgi:hypothetical protein